MLQSLRAWRSGCHRAAKGSDLQIELFVTQRYEAIIGYCTTACVRVRACVTFAQQIGSSAAIAALAGSAAVAAAAAML
jgi:hypothetical protein